MDYNIIKINKILILSEIESKCKFLYKDVKTNAKCHFLFSEAI